MSTDPMLAKLGNWMRSYTLLDGTEVQGVSITTWIAVHGRRGFTKAPNQTERQACIAYVETTTMWLTGYVTHDKVVCYLPRPAGEWANAHAIAAAHDEQVTDILNEAHQRVLPARCPDCGVSVASIFDHIDRDCTGNYPEKVTAGYLLPKES